MLVTKLVLRVLDPAGQLLGWAEARGHARGDGSLWIEQPMVIPIEQGGNPYALSVHWCDLNIETRLPLAGVISHRTLNAGDSVTLPGPWEAMSCGRPPTDLPPVTVRGSMIALPVGQLGAEGRR